MSVIPAARTASKWCSFQGKLARPWYPTCLAETRHAAAQWGFRQTQALADWKDYSKRVGGAVDTQNLTRRQMEFLQFIGYNWVFIRNGRLLDWLKFMWHYRRAGFSLVRALIRPRARRVEARDVAHVFFDDLLEVRRAKPEQESLGG